MMENDLAFAVVMSRQENEDHDKQCDGSCDCVVPCPNCTGRMKKAGAVLACESLIVNETPGADELEKCREFGRKAVV